MTSTLEIEQINKLYVLQTMEWEVSREKDKNLFDILVGNFHSVMENERDSWKKI